MIKATGTAVIKHRDSGEIYEVPSSEVYLDDSDIYERDMGREILWTAKSDHPELGDLTWSITEYPEGAIAGDPEANINGHELLTDLGFEIEYPDSDVDPDDYDDDVEVEDDDVGSLPDSVINSDAKEMRDWFLRNYENPVNSLPYVSSEGGYQWINGGPYSPLEALQEEFDRVFTFEAIEAVAQSIADEEGIDEWTPRQGEETSDERVLRFAARLDRHLPLAERLVFNYETGAFRALATMAAKPDLLKATLSRIQDALEDCLVSQSNGLMENDQEVRILRRMLTKYADDPQRIEMDTNSARKSILAKISKGALPDSDDIQHLVTTLRDAEHGLRATDANIAQNRRILQSAVVGELSTVGVQALQEAAPILEALTEGDLQQQMREDLETLSDYDGQLGGVARSEGFGRDEVTRVVGRTARILLAMKKTPEIISKIESSTLSKVGKIFSSFGKLILVFGLAIKFFFPPVAAMIGF